MQGMKRWLALIVFSAVLAAMPTAGMAQDYPTQTVRFIVPFPAGGAADLLTRLVAQKLAQALGGSFIVENRPGGNTIPAAIAVAKAPADGHTLLVAVDSTLTMNKSLYAQLPYDPVRDFAPVTLLAQQPLLLTLSPKAPFATLKEMVAYAKANPGTVNIGIGALIARIAAEQLKLMTGAEFVIVPYAGSAPSRQALLAGDIHAAFSDSASPAPFLKDGRLRALATTSSLRARGLAEVPTIVESGYAGFDVKSWYAVVAPAGTPAPVIARLNAEIARALQSPDLRARAGDQGLEIAPGSAAELAQLIRSETQKWDQVIRQARIPLVH